MRIHPHLLVFFNFLDLSHHQLLALSASNYNNLIKRTLGHDDHVTSANVPTRIKLFSILFLKTSADLTWLVKGEPFGQADRIRWHFLKLRKFENKLAFFVFGAQPTEADEDIRHVFMSEN